MRKYQQAINKYLIKPLFRGKKDFGLEPVTIISSDCCGGLFCHDNYLPLDSPTVNLIIEGTDYIKFCLSLEKYLSIELTDGGKDPVKNYPIAYCEDIKIYGVHYKSFQELNLAWTRRKKRIHKSIIFCMTERQITDEKQFNAFMKLQGKKLFLSSKEFAQNHEGAKGIENFDKMFLFAGLSGRRYIDFEFDFADWLIKSGGKVL